MLILRRISTFFDIHLLAQFNEQSRSLGSSHGNFSKLRKTMSIMQLYTFYPSQMSCISRLFPVSSFMSIIIPFLETHVPLFPCLKRWFNYFFYLSLPYKAFFIRPTHADSTQAVCVQACVSLRKYALIAVLLRLNCPSNDSGGENESWPKAHVQKQPTSRRFIRFPL